MSKSVTDPSIAILSIESAQILDRGHKPCSPLDRYSDTASRFLNNASSLLTADYIWEVVKGTPDELVSIKQPKLT